MNPLQDAFIFYGRADSKQFAKKLNYQLAELGYTVWFDCNDIPLGVDYQKQIDDGIEKADNFLYLISPHSVNSDYCNLEIEQALKHKKRIIPLLHVEEISYETWQYRNPGGTKDQWEACKAAGKHFHFANMHPAIRKINWVFFRERIDDYGDSFEGLLGLLLREKDYVHQHTVLLNDALEWERNLRMMEYRGKVSATMIYDYLPINDAFRKVDDDTVLGVMDYKESPQPFFFILRRDSGE